MKVLITGGTGLVGHHLGIKLVESGHQVIAMGRRSTHPLAGRDNFEYLAGDTSVPGDWQEKVRSVDAIVNLAGENIFRYWSKDAKQRIYDSRILTTKNLVDALAGNREVALLSTSAIGYYGDRGDEVLDETASDGDGFLANIGIDWEKEALKAEIKGARVALMRFSVILASDGGALTKMLPAFKLFAGGPMGSGMQWFSWIHIADLMAVIETILQNQNLKGPFNCCSPYPVRNRDLAKLLGQTLKRPSFLKAPTIVLKTFMGEMSTALLGSQRCLPANLLDHGFRFQYPQLDSALENLLHA